MAWVMASVATLSAAPVFAEKAQEGKSLVGSPQVVDRKSVV